MRYYLSILLCLLLVNFAIAQDEQTPYEVALERIEEAAVSGVTSLVLNSLGLTELPPEISNLRNLQALHNLNQPLNKVFNMLEIFRNALSPLVRS